MRANSLNTSLPTFITDQVWTAGGTTFPQTNVAAVSPWTSNANIDTNNGGVSQSSFYFVAPDSTSSSFTIARDFGSQHSGIYCLNFSAVQGPSRPIITVTETNTSLSIGTFDTFYPGDTAVTSVQMYFFWEATGDMNIQFSCPTKNPDSSDYEIALTGIIQLIQIY